MVDTQKSLYFDVFIMGAFAFMMPMMSFVSGYFGIGSMVHKGQLNFWRYKFYRIVIPWALGVVFLAPTIGYMHSVSRNLYPPYPGYFAHYFFGKEYQSLGQVRVVSDAVNGCDGSGNPCYEKEKIKIPDIEGQIQ